MEGREYFDAKFDGLKSLIDSHQTNTTAHINAVSRNVGRLEDALDTHKESTSAHGLEAASKSHSSIVGWLGLGLAAAIGMMDIFRSHGK